MLFLALVPAILAVQPMPPWWDKWLQIPSFSSSFVQEGESAAFGKLARRGIIQSAKGGRLRVEYENGLLLLCDGSQLIQYDPSTRTAQRHYLEDVSEEWPLLRLLTDPASLRHVFHVSPQSGGAVKLTPKTVGLPEVILEGGGNFLHKAAWTDGTGAKQELVLTSPKTQHDPGSAPFTFKLPTGAKWL